ncbi:MAG: porin [Chromatiales bacterium]|jgi:long-chain fatty acid transport protein
MQDNNTFSRSLLSLACCTTLIAFHTTSQASGFSIPELNVAGLAVSNALVANHDMQAAIAYNPAAMSFHDGNSAALGIMLLSPDLSVNTGSGFVDSDANDTVAIPAVTAHATLSETWSLGLAVNAPFGLETDWPAGTFIEAATTDTSPIDGYPVDSAIPTKSKLEIVTISPSLSYKINDNISLAGGLDIYDMREVIFNSAENNGSPTTTNSAAELQGEGRGVGLNLALMVKQGAWTFGGSYHSETRIPVDGTAASSGTTINVNAELNVPSRLQLGVRHQTTDKLGIEFDFTRTGWSSFDQLVVKHSQYGREVLTSTNNWDDANAYRLGATYDISQAIQLRAGYTFDETPQEDTFFSPRIPDSDRQLFSLGIGHTLNNGWTIDAAYMYVKFDDRTLNIDPSFTHSAPYTDETNGTSAVNGTYESSVHLLGLGVTKKFM